MLRQNLSGRGGRWFSLKAAQKFDEALYFDGENMRSKATGGQWSNETLYRSASGRWIIHRRTRIDGVPDSWREVSPAKAAQWLIANDYEEFPKELQPHVANLQVA